MTRRPSLTTNADMNNRRAGRCATYMQDPLGRKRLQKTIVFITTNGQCPARLFMSLNDDQMLNHRRQHSRRLLRQVSELIFGAIIEPERRKWQA